jgi:fructokinase
MNRVDVLSFGEALVDFIPEQTGVRLRQVGRFTRSPGGEPANLALGVARLGGQSALVCKLGADEFGYFLREALEAEGVDVEGVLHTREVRTGIIFLQIDADGERSFLYYRHPSADMTIEPEDLDLSLVRRSRIVHSGTSLLTRPGSRAANLLMVEEARRHKRLVSLDANLRLHQWSDHDRMRREVRGLLELVDLLKANDEELEIISGLRDGRRAFDEVLAPRGVRALLLTHGGGGATLLTRHLTVFEAAPEVEVVDTTGAGDAFLAGALRALTGLLQSRHVHEDAWPEALEHLEERHWRALLRVANHVGASVCTKLGAVAGLPRGEEVPWAALGLPQLAGG